MFRNKELVVEKLKRFGFSSKEGEIYINLVEYPHSNGSQISKRLGYSRTTVYSVLSRLHTKGYILSIPDKEVTSYLALDPQEVIFKLRKELTEAGEVLGRELEKIKTKPCDRNFLNINSEHGMEKTLCHILENTKEDLYIETNIDLKKFKKIEGAFKRLKKNGVKVRGSLNEDIGNMDDKVLFSGLNNTINRPESIVLVSDYKSAIIAGKTDAEFRGTLSQNEVLINVIISYIHNKFHDLKK